MIEQLSSTCSTCGRTITAGDACMACAGSRAPTRREMVLLFLLAVGAAALYFGARAFANSNRAMKINEAAYWYDEGEQQLRVHRADAAVTAFRKASLSEHNRVNTRSLAQALAEDGRNGEARELLLRERETAPDDPEINLDLARIATKEQDVPETIRYYHTALYGSWTGQNIDLQRRMVRRELIEFLIAQHAKDQTLAEILGLAAQLPNTVAAKMELGGLFLQHGDPGNAASNFRAVLRAQPYNQTALEGAGQAAFQLEDYSEARRHLRLLINPDEKAKRMLNIATLVDQNDPMDPHLSYARRRQRLLADFEQTRKQLQQCLAQQSVSPDSQALKAVADREAELKRKLIASRQREAPELAFQTLEFIHDAEETIFRSCRELQDLDSALLLIAQKSRGPE